MSNSPLRQCLAFTRRTFAQQHRLLFSSLFSSPTEQGQNRSVRNDVEESPSRLDFEGVDVNAVGRRRRRRRRRRRGPGYHGDGVPESSGTRPARPRCVSTPLPIIRSDLPPGAMTPPSAAHGPHSTRAREVKVRSGGAAALRRLPSCHRSVLLRVSARRRLLLYPSYARPQRWGSGVGTQRGIAGGERRQVGRVQGMFVPR